MKQFRERSLTGFTLIELILAVSLFFIVSASLFLSMRSGLLLYKRSDEGLTLSHEIQYFLNKLSYELRNSFHYSSIPFEGNEERLSFPSILVTYDEDKVFTDIYNIEYNFKARTLMRKSNCLSRKDDKDKKDKILYPLLKNISFSFGFLDEGEKTVIWKEEWPSELEGLIPKAVGINLVVTFFDKDMKFGVDKKINKKIWIPQGEWGSEDIL